MAKLTKFPLEMANGAKVRSIEELRENADVKSIVAYFLDGRLGRWCNAWRYDDLPARLENATAELIKNIYDVLEITVDVQEIEAYVKENSTHISSQPISYAEMEEPLTDSEEVKNKLRAYLLSRLLRLLINVSKYKSAEEAMKQQASQLQQQQVELQQNQMFVDVNTLISENNYLKSLNVSKDEEIKALRERLVALGQPV